MQLENLKKEIPYKWKLGNYNYDKTKASCLAYIDARDVMDLLDNTVGPGNWKDEYSTITTAHGILTACTLSILIDGQRVSKQDVGTSGDYEQEKSLISDAFKRAAVKRGVGRFLYDIESIWVDVKGEGNKYYPVDKNGKRVRDLTDFINKDQKTKYQSNSSSTQSIVEKIAEEVRDGDNADDANKASQKQIDFIYRLFEKLGYAQPNEMYLEKVGKKKIEDMDKTDASTIIGELNEGKIPNYKDFTSDIDADDVNDDLPF